MHKTFVVALAAAGLALGAQAAKVAYPQSEIRESTDSAKIAEVERHAAQLGAPAGGMSGSGTSAAAGDASGKTMPKKGAKHGMKKPAKKGQKGQTGDQAGNAPRGS